VCADQKEALLAAWEEEEANAEKEETKVLFFISFSVCILAL
jgi:hypothetical protein